MGDVGIVKALRQKCDDLEEQLDNANEAKEAAIEAAKELEVELASMRDQLRAEREKEKEPQACGQDAQGLESEVARLKSELEECREKQQKEIDALKEELEVAKVARQEAEQKAAEAAAQSDATTVKIASFQVDAKRSEQERETQVAELAAKLDAAEQEMTEVRKQLQAATGKTQAFEEQLDVLTKQVQTAQSEANDANQKTVDTMARFQAEEEKRDKAEKAVEELKSTLEEKNNQLHATAGKLETVEREKDAALMRAANAEDKAGQAASDAEGRVQADLNRATEACSAETERAQELEVSFGHLQHMHQALFEQYSATVEELDRLKGENKKVIHEKEQLRSSLDEESRLRKELQEAEPAGPTQLSVSDVLISVAFDGVQLPLEIKPWDTDYLDVAQKWLGAAQKSTQLLNSVVAYLKHLEDSADAFPVRVEAKLLDVHEQFGL